MKPVNIIKTIYKITYKMMNLCIKHFLGVRTPYVKPVGPKPFIAEKCQMIPIEGYTSPSNQFVFKTQHRHVTRFYTTKNSIPTKILYLEKILYPKNSIPPKNVHLLPHKI